MSIKILFLPDNIEVCAEAGESFLTVAAKGGIEIPTGCLMGSCHACEVEVEGVGDICTCITAVPADCPDLTVHLFSDPTW